MKPFVFAALTLCFAGCGPKQDPGAVLLDQDAGTRFPGQPVDPTQYSFHSSLGPASSPIPLTVQWGVIADSTGCRRIGKVHLARNGGSPAWVVDSVRLIFVPDCGADWNSSDTTRVERASIALHLLGRYGVQVVSFSGPAITIDGKGRGQDLAGTTN